MSKEIILSLLNNYDKLEKQIAEVEEKLSVLEDKQLMLDGDRDNLEEAIESLMKIERPNYHMEPCFFTTSGIRRALGEENTDV
jgi:chromosome segregation ATPase